jgi:hypothetical protein
MNKEIDLNSIPDDEKFLIKGVNAKNQPLTEGKKTLFLNRKARRALKAKMRKGKK